MPKRRIELDEKQFVRSYLSGRHNIRELAGQFGLSESFARKIICGDRRPEIAKAIDQGRDARARRLEVSLTSLGDDAIGLLGKALEGEPTGSAIAAAREVLRRALPPEQPKKKMLPDFFDDFPPLTPEEDDEDDEALEEYLADDAEPRGTGRMLVNDNHAPLLRREDGQP